MGWPEHHRRRPDSVFRTSFLLMVNLVSWIFLASVMRAFQKTLKQLGEMVTSYLAKRTQLMLSIHIVDSRHEPTKLDLQLHDWLKHSAKPRLIVATKSDKLSNNELRESLGRVKRMFGEDA